MKQFLFPGIHPSVALMAGMRFLSATIELTAAILILITNDVRKAVVINSILAMIGPLIFIITMTIGIYQIAGQFSYAKLILIFLGVVFILVGIYK
ncbi:YqhV family protein [Bacillus sp. Bos-x628]|uniref:YqhV family protein n=1 Tax=Bacillus maqinnsis TaxID=3229854 RepID=UPI00338FC06B